MLPVVLVCLNLCVSFLSLLLARLTYERKAAVAAWGNLRLVGVDKDSGMALGSTTAIASNNSVVSPPDGLLVDHFHSRFGLGLSQWLIIAA